MRKKEIGFRVLPDGSGGFVFELYVGEDRSYAQSNHPWVIFSPNFENILSSNYLESSKNLRTVSLVGGEGEGAERVLSEATDDDGGGTGLSRREMFTDAAGVSKLLESSYVDDEGNTVEATYMTDAEYDEQLKQKGKEELAKSENSVTKSFEGEIDGSRQFVYKRFQHRRCGAGGQRIRSGGYLPRDGNRDFSGRERRVAEPDLHIYGKRPTIKEGPIVWHLLTASSTP